MAGARQFFVRPFGGVLRIDVTDADVQLLVDGRADQVLITPALPDPDDGSNSADLPMDAVGAQCRWRIAAQDLALIFAADHRRVETTYVSGRLKISGDLGIMARMEGENE